MKRIFTLAIALISIMSLSAQKLSYPYGNEPSRELHKYTDFSVQNAGKDAQLLPYRLTGRVASDDFEEQLFYYDGYGRVVAVHESNGFGDQIIDSVTYDAAGCAVRVDGWQMINSEWKNVYYVCYAYNSDNQVIQRTNFNNFGAEGFVQGGVYDYVYEDGKLVSHTMYFGDYDDLYEECYYSYDAAGKLLQEVYLQGFSTLDSTIKIDYTYNEAGLLASKNLYYYYYGWDLEEFDEYLYDDHGNCIEHNIYEASGNYKDRRLYEYNTDVSATQIHTPYNVPELYLPEALSDVHQRTLEHWYTLDADHVLQYICDYEYVYNHTAVGISQNEIANEVSVYPNPTQSSLQVVVSENRIAENAVIYDFQGRICMQVQLNAGECSVDVSDLPSGIYLLKVTLDNGSHSSQKFIKQ